MSNLNINVLEKITSVYYKNKLLTIKEVESFFNRRKRSMTFFVDNEYIEAIKQCNYGYLELFYKDGTTIKISGKVLSFEKSKYEEEYFVGINVGNEKELTKTNLIRTEMMEAIIFLKRIKSFDAVYPDLTVLFNNQDKIVKIPYYNLEEELIYEEIMSREKALDIKTS